MLIGRFMERNPGVNLKIRGGSADDIVADLLNGETELAFSSANSAEDNAVLESTPICTRTALIMVPREHPFARRESIELKQLTGLAVVVSPGYLEPYGNNGALGPLISVGADIAVAPEPRRATIELYARVHRVMCIRWMLRLPSTREVGDMVLVPIRGNPLQTTTALWRRRGARSKSALAFWRSAILLRRVIASGDAEPMYGAIKDEIERPLAEPLSAAPDPAHNAAVA
jgi:DNA-binding transcriptional LysR family regulator